MKGTRYDTGDFEILHPMTTTRLVIAVRKNLPAKNLEELIELARSRSATEPLSVGIPGLGSLYHLIPDSMAKQASLTLNFIPYKGTAPIIQDLIGERIDFTVMAYSTTILPFVQDGRYRVVANLSRDKPKELANLKSLSELPMFRNMDYASNTGYYVKKGTPLAVRQALNSALANVAASPAVIQALEADGRRVYKRTTLSEAERFYQNEVATYQQLVRQTGFKPVD
ncbi:MAG: hypothetical protein EOO27_48730 [Comamonadaceae bacterium]|nr:MAG: hypothetical protein EOO27_48730 [Comamonadaceae bacterium]